MYANIMTLQARTKDVTHETTIYHIMDLDEYKYQRICLQSVSKIRVQIIIILPLLNYISIAPKGPIGLGAIQTQETSPLT